MHLFARLGQLVGLAYLALDCALQVCCLILQLLVLVLDLSALLLHLVGLSLQLLEQVPHSVALHGLLLEEFVLALSELLLLIDDFLTDDALVFGATSLLHGLDIAGDHACLAERRGRALACSRHDVVAKEALAALQVILAVTVLA